MTNQEAIKKRNTTNFQSYKYRDSRRKQLERVHPKKKKFVKDWGKQHEL